MARLPSERYVIQQHDGLVVLSEDGSEREIVRFDPADANASAIAQGTIHRSELNDEDKCFAHFWSGYFHAHAVSGTDSAVIAGPMPPRPRRVEADHDYRRRQARAGGPPSAQPYTEGILRGDYSSRDEYDFVTPEET